MSELNFTELRIDTSKAPDDTLANITVIEHTLPDWWVKAAEERDLWFTNMVLMPDGAVYVGERRGVIGVKDARRMQRVKAFVVLEEDVPADDRTRNMILQKLKKNIAAYAIPKEIEFREELPRRMNITTPTARSIG